MGHKPGQSEAFGFSTYGRWRDGRSAENGKKTAKII
jgi:hypothetical protein